MKNNTTPSFSRRGFINIAVGTLTTLPAVAGGFLVPIAPSEARAEEADASNSGDVQARIVVVRPYEVGFVVHDVSKTPDTAGYKVQGATIKVTSRFNKESMSDTTDQDGIHVFDITNLSEDEDKKADPPSYGFNGTIEITAPGYRDVILPLVRVKGGEGLEVPIQPLEEGVPYPRSISFDEWDVLYTKNEFISSTDEGYDVDHSIEVQLGNVPDGSVEVALTKKGSTTPIATGKATASSGSAKITIKQMFLWISDKNTYCLKPDTSYSVSYTTGGKTYVVPLQISICKADADATNPTTSGDLKMSPFNDLSSFETGMHFPKDLPVIGGDEMVPWIPTWPVNVAFDPFGYFCISYTSPKWGYKKDNGTDDPVEWKKFPRKTAEQQFNKWSGQIQDRMSKLGENAELKPKVKQMQLISVFEFGFSFSAMAAAQYAYGDEGVRQWRGNANAAVTVSADYSLSEQFTVGFVPILLQLNIHAALTVGAGLGFVSPKAFSFDKYRWDYTSTGLTVRFVIAPSLSVGVGIKGVASVSLRGAFSLTIFIGVNPLPKDHGPNIKNPHVIVGISATLSVVIQLLFYTKKIKITGYEEPNLYNSWQAKSLAENLASGGPANLRELIDDMQIVPSASLAERAEFTSNGFGMPSNGVASKPTAFLKGEKKTLTTNGKEYRVVVYRRVETAEALTLLGAENSALEGKSSKGEQRTLLKEWKSKGLIPMWDSGSNALTASWSGSLMANERAYAFDRPTFDVNALGALGGVHVISDIKIASNVLSDPRSKIVSVWGKPFVLRLVSALIGGEARTRIAAQQIDESGATTGKLYMLEFDAGAGIAPRDQLYDYDFDVVATQQTDSNGNKRHDMHLLVFSGLRESGDDTSFMDASLDHLASYVRWSFLSADNFDSQSVAWAGVDPDDIHAAVDPTDPEDWYHMYCCPQVRLIQDEGGSAVVLSYLDRAGKEAEDVFGESKDSTRVGVGMFFCSTDWEFGKLALPDLSDLRSVIGEFDDLTVSEMTCSDRPKGGYHTIMLRGTEKAHYLIVNTKAVADTLTLETQSAGSESMQSQDGEAPVLAAQSVEPTAGEPQDTEGLAEAQAEGVVPFVVGTAEPEGQSDSEPIEDVPDTEDSAILEAQSDPQGATGAGGTLELSVPGFGDIRRVDDSVFEGNERMQLIAVPNDSYFLTSATPSGSKESQLMRAEWQVGDAVSLGLSEFGPTGFAIAKFCVHPTGRFIFWPAVRDGNAPFEYDKDGNSSQGKENTYNLMACRLRNGKFSDPFVLAQLDHPMDTLTVLEDEISGMAMLGTHVVNAETGEGDVYFTVVEHAVCASIASADAVMPIVAPESEVSFYVAIRNDGNTYITGLSVSVQDSESETSLGSQKLTFGKDTLVESSYNPRGDDGNLIYVEDDYALAPGKTSLYRVKGYKVPKDWAGDYMLDVTIDSGSVVPADDIVGVGAEAAGDEIYRYEPAHEEMKQELGDGTTVLAGRTGFKVTDPEQIAQGDYAAAPIREITSGGGGGSSTPKKTSLATTGDATEGTSALAAALGLAGAAMLAYSKRRSDLESERDND